MWLGDLLNVGGSSKGCLLGILDSGDDILGQLINEFGAPKRVLDIVIDNSNVL